MFRLARFASHRGSRVASAIGGTIFVAIALLIVTISVLTTESRVYIAGQKAATWHTSKLSQMTESGGDKLGPVQTDDSLSTPPLATIRVTPYYFTPTELPLPTLACAPQAHGLRAPPRV